LLHIYHPWDAELVGHHAEALGPERGLPCEVDLAALCERVEQLLAFFDAIERDREREARITLRSLISTAVASHHRRFADLERRVHDALALVTLRGVLGRRFLVAQHEEHLRTKGFLVELERFFASAVKSQIRLYLHDPLLVQVGCRRLAAAIVSQTIPP